MITNSHIVSHFARNNIKVDPMKAQEALGKIDQNAIRANIRSKMHHTTWDGTTPINGIPAEVWIMTTPGSMETFGVNQQTIQQVRSCIASNQPVPQALVQQVMQDVKKSKAVHFHIYHDGILHSYQPHHPEHPGYVAMDRAPGSPNNVDTVAAAHLDRHAAEKADGMVMQIVQANVQFS